MEIVIAANDESWENTIKNSSSLLYVCLVPYASSTVFMLYAYSVITKYYSWSPSDERKVINSFVPATTTHRNINSYHAQCSCCIYFIHRTCGIRVCCSKHWASSIPISLLPSTSLAHYGRNLTSIFFFAFCLTSGHSMWLPRSHTPCTVNTANEIVNILSV